MALALSPSVDTHTPPASSTDVGTAGLWRHSFPSADLVSAAAGLFTGHRVDDRLVRVGERVRYAEPFVWESDEARQEVRDWMRSHGIPVEPIAEDLQRPLWDPTEDQRAGLSDRTNAYDLRAAQREPVMVEGPRSFVLIGPGVVQVRRTDPARADRAAQRAAQRAWSEFRLTEDRIAAGEDLDAILKRPEGRNRGLVTGWSDKSRANMVKTLAALDWSPLFSSDRIPAMVTVTYPGDWLAVAPNAAASARHIRLLRQRYYRAWGHKLVGAWKREFQRRGAPHYHFLMVPPHGTVDGKNFAQWLSETWADIVSADSCGASLDDCQTATRGAGCEYHRHVLAGTGIDYADGVRARDPKTIGVYFSKHGSWSEKEYQNYAPAEWSDHGSVGRFWGVWGLSRALAGVEVHPDEALAAARVMRRYSRANSYVARVEVWRYRTRTDEEGFRVQRWRPSTKLKRIYRVKRDTGYLVVKDGPVFAAQLARHLDRLRRPTSVIGRSGAGPIGFLP